jgi:hypothetical protein
MEIPLQTSFSKKVTFNKKMWGLVAFLIGCFLFSPMSLAVTPGDEFFPKEGFVQKFVDKHNLSKQFNGFIQKVNNTNKKFEDIKESIAQIGDLLKDGDRNHQEFEEWLKVLIASANINPDSASMERLIGFLHKVREVYQAFGQDAIIPVTDMVIAAMKAPFTQNTYYGYWVSFMESSAAIGKILKNENGLEGKMVDIFKISFKFFIKNNQNLQSLVAILKFLENSLGPQQRQLSPEEIQRLQGDQKLLKARGEVLDFQLVDDQGVINGQQLKAEDVLRNINQFIESLDRVSDGSHGAIESKLMGFVKEHKTGVVVGSIIFCAVSVKYLFRKKKINQKSVHNKRPQSKKIKNKH